MQFVLGGGNLQDPPKQYSLRGMSADMRITNALQLAVRRAHDTDTGNVEALRRYISHKSCQHLDGYTFDLALQRSDCQLSITPRQIHYMMMWTWCR